MSLEKSRTQLISKLNHMLRGLFDDLLTRGIDEDGEIRDPERHPADFGPSVLGPVPMTWTVGSVGDVLERIDAGKSPDCPDRPASTGEWGVLKVSSVRPEGFAPWENKVLVNPRLADPRNEVQDGDLLMTRANTLELIAMTCLVENPPRRLLLCDKTLRLVLRPSINSRYMSFALKAPYIRRQVEGRATGTSGSMKNVSQAAIKSFKLLIPPRPEQDELTERLTAFQQRVHTEGQVLAKLQLLKHGLMEDLVTGRVRVTAALEAAPA